MRDNETKFVERVRPGFAKILDIRNDEQIVPAWAVDAESNRVLLPGFMNEAALIKTIETGLATFWSRSAGALWTKGETSGNFLRVRSIVADCDADSLILLVEPIGPACHTGEDSCFDETPVIEVIRNGENDE